MQWTVLRYWFRWIRKCTIVWIVDLEFAPFVLIQGFVLLIMLQPTSGPYPMMSEGAPSAVCPSLQSIVSCGENRESIIEWYEFRVYSLGLVRLHSEFDLPAPRLNLDFELVSELPYWLPDSLFWYHCLWDRGLCLRNTNCEDSQILPRQETFFLTICNGSRCCMYGLVACTTV